jgi:branched-chain amino acid transport system substrate-binding protein
MVNVGRNVMLTRRTFTAAGVAAAAVSASGVGAWAQTQPLRIGFSIAQTGGLAAGGKAGLLALQMWADEVNASGGVLGRKVELVAYDDQSNAAQAPAIYSKLIDVDKVDILLSPYGTNVAGPTLPIAKEHNRLLFGMFVIGLNAEIKYNRYFAMGPWGPDPQLTYQAFFQLARDNGLKKMAIIAADAQFQQSAADGGRRLAKEYGITIVFDQRYPANTTDFSGLLQSLQGVEPDIVYVCSYPTESAAIVRGIDEIGLPSSVQLFGGGMVGIQNASLLESLGKQLNGIVNYDTASIDPKLMHPGAKEFYDSYAGKAAAAKVDPLGHFLPPYWYATGQVIKAAVEATKGTDDNTLAEWLHANEIPTILGPIRFGASGEWAENRVLMVQYQNVAPHDIEQFRTAGKVVVIAPEQYRTGDFKHPFDKART